MELICTVQNSEWGKKGSKSIVARLQKNSNPEFQLDEGLHYAELWMGTHVNGPSVLKKSKETLLNYILKYPEYLGYVSEESNKDLPFLFKVLSVNKALSIQAHPSKAHAEELHSKFPNIYKDPNHKPEMAIALTPFEALCGFKPFLEIKQFIMDIPELRAIIGTENLSDESQFVKNAFRAVLTCGKEEITFSINSLLKRFKGINNCERQTQLAELVERLHCQFPYDNGILMVYFLNYLQLKPHEALFLGANEPHAYLFGDCIECMACSDNVVRAGLTPKFVDVETLCSMLTYHGEKPEAKLLPPIQEDKYSWVFKPPVSDFAVVQIQVPISEDNYETPKKRCASILLIVSGQAQYNNGNVVPGTVLFLPANECVQFSNIMDDLLIYQALANV